MTANGNDLTTPLDGLCYTSAMEGNAANAIGRRRLGHRDIAGGSDHRQRAFGVGELAFEAATVVNQSSDTVGNLVGARLERRRDCPKPIFLYCQERPRRLTCQRLDPADAARNPAVAEELEQADLTEG